MTINIDMFNKMHQAQKEKTAADVKKYQEALQNRKKLEPESFDDSAVGADLKDLQDRLAKSIDDLKQREVKTLEIEPEPLNKVVDETFVKTVKQEEPKAKEEAIAKSADAIAQQNKVLFVKVNEDGRFEKTEPPKTDTETSGGGLTASQVREVAENAPKIDADNNKAITEAKKAELAAKTAEATQTLADLKKTTAKSSDKTLTGGGLAAANIAKKLLEEKLPDDVKKQNEAKLIAKIEELKAARDAGKIPENMAQKIVDRKLEMEQKSVEPFEKVFKSFD